MIYAFIAEGFEELEAIAPLDLLRRAKVAVQSVAVGNDRTITGAHGIPLTCDLTIEQLDLEEVEGIILPGGPGHEKLYHAKVQMAIEAAAARRGLLAAICAAPAVLGKYGQLLGRRACCFPGYENALFGAQVLDDPVLRDGNVITARGAGVAVEFALAIIRFLRAPETADAIAAQIQAP